MFPFMMMVPVLCVVLALPAWWWSRRHGQLAARDVWAVVLPIPMFLLWSLVGLYCDDDGAYLICGLLVMPLQAVLLTWLRVGVANRVARNTGMTSWIFFALSVAIVPLAVALWIPDDHCNPCEHCTTEPWCYERCGG